MSRLFKNLAAATGPAEKNAAALPPPTKKTPPTAVPGPNPGPVTELLFAWKAASKNPQLLTAYRPGTDPTNPNNLVTVNVRNNVNFLPHMRLRVSKVKENVFDLVGPLPRWRGRY